MSNEIMIKDLSKDEIQNFTNEQAYNVLFALPIKWKKMIESGRSGDDSAVAAVYGATIVPIMRRINALDELSEYIDLINIILSGGRSWDSVNPKRFESLEEIKKYYHTDKYKRWVGTKVSDIMEKIPAIKQVVLNRMREEFINNRLSQMGIDIEYISCIDSIRNSDNNNSNNLKQKLEREYQEFYDKIKNNIVKKLSKNEQTLKLLYDKYQKKCIKEQKAFKEYEEWKEEYVDDYIVSQYILNRMTEADFMEIDWKFYHNGEEKGTNIIKDEKACDSSDNARNTIREFIKLREKNPNLKTLIVISEWPYLLRQVLTTQKMAKEMGYDDIEIIGYPADSEPGIGMKFDDMDKFRNGPVSGIITNILKLLYDDCGNVNIEPYINQSDLISDGPRIIVAGKEFDGTVAGNDERE